MTTKKDYSVTKDMCGNTIVTKLGKDGKYHSASGKPEAINGKRESSKQLVNRLLNLIETSQNL